jgi:hypothetical protein
MVLLIPWAPLGVKMGVQQNVNLNPASLQFQHNYQEDV